LISPVTFSQQSMKPVSV